mmetsp:Transcript_2811/g.7026  ORF Transcript_2811/g.7026 Transcript_2811/m.7026 type:complete len:245 (+) Transcript_2811:615-1349(+)
MVILRPVDPARNPGREHRFLDAGHLVERVQDNAVGGVRHGLDLDVEALRVEGEADVIGVQHLEYALLQLDDLDPPILVYAHELRMDLRLALLVDHVQVRRPQQLPLVVPELNEPALSGSFHVIRHLRSAGGASGVSGVRGRRCRRGGCSKAAGGLELAREAADAVLGVDRVAVLVETADLVLALRADDVLLLEEVRVVKEDRVVALVLPAVYCVEDRGELVQLVVHRTHLLEEDSDTDICQVCG